METSLITPPTVRNLEEAREQCLEYDAVLTAGPNKDEVSDFNHPIHKVVQFSDTAYEKSGGPASAASRERPAPATTQADDRCPGLDGRNSEVSPGEVCV